MRTILILGDGHQRNMFVRCRWRIGLALTAPGGVDDISLGSTCTFGRHCGVRCHQPWMVQRTARGFTAISMDVVSGLARVPAGRDCIGSGLARYRPNIHGCCVWSRADSPHPATGSGNIHGCWGLVSRDQRQYPWMFCVGDRTFALVSRGMRRCFAQPVAMAMDVAAGRAQVTAAGALTHSHLSASIGCSAAAFQAGYQPKPMPIIEQTARPARVQPQGKTMAMSK